jgi:hypothetical protein
VPPRIVGTDGHGEVPPPPNVLTMPVSTSIDVARLEVCQ